MKRYFLQTFGCQMNVHDSRRIVEALDDYGYQATHDAGTADLIIFNTCSVRDKAEHKLVSAVGALRSLKKKRADLIIAVAGCMAQQYGEALLKKIDFIDLVIGPDNIVELPCLVARVKQAARPLVRTVFDLDDPSFLRARAAPRGNRVAEYVTIMKGCNERCAFCIVPTTRGSERYRRADEIIDEIRQLVEGGIREVTLLGQTVNSWYDPDQKEKREKFAFAYLLRRIALEVPKLIRLRYTSPHPGYLTPALITAHAELDLLPWHLHLPVQSGSDRMLKRMVRRYSRNSYLEKTQALLKARPGLTFSTDFIVGFPGETEDDFQQTLSLVREVGFVTAFAFKYSPRPNTPALKLGDPVPESVKNQRLERLFELLEAQQSAHNKSLVGTKTRVLLEKANLKDINSYSGRSHRHEIVHVEVPAGIDFNGRLVEVMIERANRHSLIGSLTGNEIATRAASNGVLISSPDETSEQTHNSEAMV